MDHRDHQFPALSGDEDAEQDGPEPVSPTPGAEARPDTISYDNGASPGQPAPRGSGSSWGLPEGATPSAGPGVEGSETVVQADVQRAKVSWVGRSDRPGQPARKGWLERITVSLTAAPARRPSGSGTAGGGFGAARPGALPDLARPEPPSGSGAGQMLGPIADPTLGPGAGQTLGPSADPSEPGAVQMLGPSADPSEPGAGAGSAATARDPRDEVTFVPARPEAKAVEQSGLGLAGSISDLEPVFPVAPQRNPVIATATGAAIGVVGLLCFLAGPPAVLVITSVLLALAMAECYRAFQRARFQPAAAIGLVAAPGAAVAAYFAGPLALPLVGAFVVVASFCWYLGGVTRRSPVLNLGATIMGWAWVGLLGGFAGLLLDPAVFPHRAGLALLLGAVEATVAYDVGGYLFGSWLGKRPMLPRISPKKTWEGLVGGCVAAFVVAIAVASQMNPWSYERGVLLGLVVVVLAPLGDLAESMVKRDLGLKDMGSLLPAHGGALDRIDGLLFVLPATYCLARLLHW